MGTIEEARLLLDGAKETATSVARAVYDWEREIISEFISPGQQETLGPVIPALLAAQALIAGTAAFIVMLLGVPLFALLIWVLRNLAAPTAVAVLELIDKVRQELRPELNQILAGAMSELLGVQISEEELSQGPESHNQLALATAVGSKFMAVLEDEFAPGGFISAATGPKAAAAFVGFSVNFATTTAFISIVGELLSFGELEEFRELGSTMASTLGLGRLARRGLSELVGVTVGQPYEWHLQRKYRPSRLTTGQVFRAMRRGTLSFDEAYEELAQAGWSDKRINVLADLEGVGLGTNDLERLVRWGAITRQAALDKLARRGMDPDEAELELLSAELVRADTRLNEFINVLEQQTLNGFITFPVYRDIISALPLNEPERREQLVIVGQRKEVPFRQLTLAQMRTAFINGIVDLFEWQQFLEVEGYSDDDKQILTIQLLLDLADSAEGRARREERARRREQSGQQTPPPP